MAPLFLRVIQHLLPRSPAWSLTFNKMLAKFFAGLASPLDDPDPQKSPRAFADAIFLDVLPPTSRQRPEWLTQFGLEPGANDAADVLQLAAAWRAQGGQSPAYIQGVLQAAGFDLYVHEWWSSGPPYVARDPRTYTQRPLIGTYQCAPVGLAGTKPACSPRILNQPQCNDFLGNEPGYLVNKDLTPRPPPAVPDDSATWPFFFYLGAATFPNRVDVPASRRAELERLVLKLRPNHQWVVMLVDYVGDEVVTVDGVTVTVDGVPVTV